MKRSVLQTIYRDLLRTYGPRSWWPAESPFEVMIGAILTQNAAWTNVEKGLVRLRALVPLEPERILSLSPESVADALRPVGYFNVKAQRVLGFCQWLIAHGGVAGLSQWDTQRLRAALLAVHGIGPETADDILLYAFNRPVFVIDAYTRRFFGRLGLIQGDEKYDVLRQLFEVALKPDAAIFGEYHALIIEHGKHVCRARPQCAVCGWRKECPVGSEDC